MLFTICSLTKKVAEIFSDPLVLHWHNQVFGCNTPSPRHDDNLNVFSRTPYRNFIPIRFFLFSYHFFIMAFEFLQNLFESLQENTLINRLFHFCFKY